MRTESKPLTILILFRFILFDLILIYWFLTQRSVSGVSVSLKSNVNILMRTLAINSDQIKCLFIGDVTTMDLCER